MLVKGAPDAISDYVINILRQDDAYLSEMWVIIGLGDGFLPVWYEENDLTIVHLWSVRPVRTNFS